METFVFPSFTASSRSRMILVSASSCEHEASPKTSLDLLQSTSMRCMLIICLLQPMDAITVVSSKENSPSFIFINAQKLFQVSRNCGGRPYTSPNSLGLLLFVSAFKLSGWYSSQTTMSIGLHVVFGIPCMVGTLLMHNQIIFLLNPVVAYLQ